MRAPSPTLSSLRRATRVLADPGRAVGLSRFFKTGPGEYGAGDRFLGLTMPQVRALSARYERTPLPLVRRLLSSPWHEERMLALLILIRQYADGTPAERRRIASIYLRDRAFINNWDLIDVSAPHILGQAWADEDRGWLSRLTRSKRVWDRRLAVLTTFADIRRGRFDRALAIVTALLGDRHDLIHKAAGWMLREIGKQERRVLEAYLDRHAAEMPRTMLRYAVERLPPGHRRRYLAQRQAAGLPRATGRRRTKQSGTPLVTTSRDVG